MMEWTSSIEAVLFAMDGTLLDSEPLTESAISQLLQRYGIHDSIDGTQFHGVTWNSIANTLYGLYPVLSDVAVAAELASGFHQALISDDPAAIPGSPDAVMGSAYACRFDERAPIKTRGPSAYYPCIWMTFGPVCRPHHDNCGYC